MKGQRSKAPRMSPGKHASIRTKRTLREESLGRCSICFDFRAHEHHHHPLRMAIIASVERDLALPADLALPQDDFFIVVCANCHRDVIHKPSPASSGEVTEFTGTEPEEVLERGDTLFAAGHNVLAWLLYSQLLRHGSELSIQGASRLTSVARVMGRHDLVTAWWNRSRSLFPLRSDPAKAALASAHQYQALDFLITGKGDDADQLLREAQSILDALPARRRHETHAGKGVEIGRLGARFKAREVEAARDKHGRRAKDCLKALDDFETDYGDLDSAFHLTNVYLFRGWCWLALGDRTRALHEFARIRSEHRLSSFANACFGMGYAWYLAAAEPDPQTQQPKQGAEFEDCIRRAATETLKGHSLMAITKSRGYSVPFFECIDDRFVRNADPVALLQAPYRQAAVSTSALLLAIESFALRKGVSRGLLQQAGESACIEMRSAVRRLCRSFTGIAGV